ncbi:hypothetical protein LMG19145_00345 [Xanthomonas arboricola pv. fragariae]|nr:hypothetical protein XarCFBP6771_14745 [Xanthomonas arboricola]PPT59104.1 hypothetical protein XarbCFBP8153_13170 [Xanthomonas arboricola]SOU09262.1 hypothetical protein LMG19145_00345 [Xanthomonas arboricola pv. fragariae]
MPKCFVIEDESHAEQIGEYASLDDAWAELERLAAIPWDKYPNVAPCTSWQTCGRTYEIIEYETSSRPWQEKRRVAGLDVSVNGVAWGSEAPRHGS